MPALYGITSNANVSVSNTTGLYIGSGNVTILNSAGTLLNLLSNAGTVGFYSTNSGTQVAASVDPSGVTAGTYGNASLVPVITVGADGRITSVSTVAPTVSTYGNANVAVYLASNTDPTISNLNANTQQQQLQINTISANVGAFETYANIYFANLQANSNTYSNANVQSYLPIYTRSLPNLSSLNTVGNITASTGTGYFVGDGRYLVNLPTQAGTYSNANVASYLPTYSGNFGNLSSTIQIFGSGVPTYGASITVGAFSQANINLGGSGLYASNVTIYKTDTTSFQGNTYILNYLPGGINAPTATGGYLTVSNTATVGNIVTTNGIFWSNGAVYSPTNTYGNTQVTALLASGTIAVNGTSIFSTGTLITGSSNNTIFNAVQPTGALAAPYGGVGIGLDLYVRGNILNLGTANIGNITTVSGVFWSNGQPYSSGSGTYGNANVAAYLPTYSGNLSPGNVLTNNYLYANGTSIFTGITSNAASLQTQINSTNANVTAANLTIANLSANVGAFETYANIYFANLQANSNTYSNANVASYLPVYNGNLEVANVNISQFATFATITTPTYLKGQVWYDTVQDSLAYYNSITNNEINIGQELQFNVNNGTGSTINQGVPVYLTGGSVGTTPNVAPAQANTISTSQVAGVANQNIPAGTIGSVVTIGLVANVSMGSFSVGDTLYLSPYSAGQIQNTQPPTGFVVKIGTVIYNNSPNGIFLVNKTIPATNQSFGNLTVTGNITTGNISSTNGYYWANGVSYASTVSGTYSNANVASYLPTYSGNFGNVSSTINITGGSGSLQVGGTTGFSNVTIGGTGSYAGNVVVYGTDINDFGNVYVLNRSPSFGSTPGTTGGYLTVSNTATVNALVTTTGVFWGNGSAYQPGGGGSYGNLQVAQFLPISTDNFGGNLVNTLASNANIRITTLGANAVIDAHSTTTGLSLPTGANSQRPYLPWAGTIRYNTDIYAPEYWSGNAWVAFGSNVVVPTTTITTRYLIVAGGGGGGRGGAAGGGAGGLLTGNVIITLDGTAYSIVIGAGGLANPGTGSPPCVNSGFNGANSTALGLTAIGGGGGGPNYNQAGGVVGYGGSGGGGGEGSTLGGSGTAGQGNNGGRGGYTTSPYYAGGGGGGAGVVGAAGNPYCNGSGGNGLAVDITGTSTYYAGGGGGSTYQNGVISSGGLGGGGAGSDNSYNGGQGTAGGANTGGGGGASNGPAGGYGGSGVAIFNYKSATQKMSGGTVTTYGSGACTHYVHTFTGSGTLTASYTAPVTYTASYLIVAGGGGSGRAGAGGGGAGGLLSSTATLTPGTTYTIVVGAGGSAGTAFSSPGNHGGSGYCSTALGLTAIGGGGGGGSSNVNGFSGGSGGGGAANNAAYGCGGSGTSGQGTSGGIAYPIGSPYPGAGGGGAGVAGTSTSGSTPGGGGNGLQISITGTATYYAGGGGGAAAGSSGTGGTGGAGGGGNGINGNASCGIAGTANTGGGGGSGWNGCIGGAAGGSGVVILSVPTANYSGTTSGSPTISTSGSNTIITFTASGSYTA